MQNRYSDQRELARSSNESQRERGGEKEEMEGSSQLGIGEMAADLCRQISSVFSSPAAAQSPYGSPLDSLVEEISLARRHNIFLHGVGREGLMMRALCMRLYHLGLASYLVGDMTTPPAAAGDLLLASAGPGDFSTVAAIAGAARAAGARVGLLTAQPELEGKAWHCADRIVFIPAQTMADEDGGCSGTGVRLPMGSLYEGAMFVLFEMAVLRLGKVLGVDEKEMRARHTNLE